MGHLNALTDISLGIMEGRRPLGDWRDAMQGHLFVLGQDVNGSDPTQVVRFPLRTEAELMSLERPTQLIDGIMSVGGLAALVGQPGVAKTFVGLDWAQSVRADIPWVQGRAVHSGPVVYVLAEGAASLGPRLRVWTDYQRNGEPAGVQFLTQAVQLTDKGDVSAFLHSIDQQLDDPPVLIVFDTLARCAVGMEENSAKEMGLLVAGVDRIREETGSAVLLVHHTNVSGERERGNTALRGAVDTMMSLKRTEDGYLELECLKQKDAPLFDPIGLELTPQSDSALITPRSGLELFSDELLSGEATALRQLQAIEMPE